MVIRVKGNNNGNDSKDNGSDCNDHDNSKVNRNGYNDNASDSRSIRNVFSMNL